MYILRLAGKPYDRGLTQGSAYRTQMRELLDQCPIWLNEMAPSQVAAVRETMVAAVRILAPDMASELEGIAAGSGLALDDVYLLNFVSAIGALKGCSNVIAVAPQDETGPVLAKTSDIGDDQTYYSVQHVEPDKGHSFLAVSWIGCLWAEVGVNAAGLAAGQSSAPTMPGQQGSGIPTLQYPRIILQRCSDVEQAIALCQETPMVGKGLNISLADASGKTAVVSKSGTRTAVRRHRSGSGGLCCTNHFVNPEMADMIPLFLPGIPDLELNSRLRLDNASRFLDEHPTPGLSDLASLLMTRIDAGGLCQDQYPELTTHYVYLVRPAEREMLVGSGRPCCNVSYTTYCMNGLGDQKLDKHQAGYCEQAVP